LGVMAKPTSGLIQVIGQRSEKNTFLEEEGNSARAGMAHYRQKTDSGG
jgi:hypothetical protein